MKRFLSLVLVTLAFAAISHAAELIAHFPLDENGESGDFVPSIVTGVEFGSPGANGNTGASASFEGSGLIQHDWSETLNPESFTLALWAKSDGGAGAWNSPVTSRHDLNPDSQGYLIYDNEPSGAWTFWSGNGTDDGNWQILDGPEVIVGEWQHIAITYDNEAEVKKLFVDGELVAESEDTLAPNDTTPFNIGAGEDFGAGFQFVGDLDDIGLWAGALTVEEILIVMEGGVLALDGGGAVVVDLDRDDDGISNSLEERHGLDPDVADSDSDKDGDGLTALVEILELKTDPNKADTDEDGLNDNVETNTGTYVDGTDTGTNPLVADSDNDGLSDGVEIPGGEGPGTSPVLSDTDGDRFSDGGEVRGGSNPLDPNSNPGALVAFWPLDTDGASADGSFVPTLDDGVEFGEPGARPFTGQSASFDGSSVIQFDHSADLNPESFTLTVWARSEGGAGAWNSPITSRNDLNPDSQGYLIYDSEPSGSWSFWSGNGIDAGNWQVLDGPEVLVSEWQHVAISYDDDAEVKKLYVDGELVAESEDTLSPNDTTPFNIGAGQDFGDGFQFVGEIDNMALFRTVLSDDDVAFVFENGVLAFTGDAASFVITQVTRGADGQVSLTWPSFPGSFYDVEASADLTSGSWQPVLTDLPAASDPATETSAMVSGLNTPMNFLRVVQVPTPPLLESSFEDGAAGWTVGLLPGGVATGTTWEFGVPINGPPAARTGDRVAGTALTESYENATMVVLRTPVIEPSGLTGLRLNFWYFIDSTADEGGQISILEESGDLITTLEPLFLGGDGNTADWTEASIRLPNLEPARPFIVQFAFLSGDDGDPDNGAGWFLDDVRVGK